MEWYFSVRHAGYARPGVLTKLEPRKGSLWHAFCRKWDTECKHLPDVDVAGGGRRSDTVSLEPAYQQADAETRLRAVLGPGQHSRP